MSKLNPAYISGIAFLVSFAALLLLQGGYYSGPACLIGVFAGACSIAIAMWAVVAKKSCRCSLASVGFIVIGACALLSCMVNEGDILMLAEAFPWFSVAGFGLLCDQVGDRDRFVRWFAVLGVACAAAAILMAADLVPYPGSFIANRLQFTFQYANAAGIFFAVVTVLAVCSDDRKLRRLGVIPMFAMLLTRSMGASIAFASAAVIMVVTWSKRNEMSDIIGFIASVLFAFIAFAVCVMFGGQWALLCAVVAGCANWFTIGWLHRVKDRLPSRRVVLGCLIVGTALVIGSASVLLPDRLVQAASTMIERSEQIRDACALIVAHPIYGLGPDGWDGAYALVQTTDYIASSVHCSYLQVWLDTGIVGFAVFVCLIGMGLWQAFKDRQIVIGICLLMLAVHFLVDFDIQFAAIGGLLVFLLSCAMGNKERMWIPDRAQKVVACILSVVVIATCIAGVAVNEYIDSNGLYEERHIEGM